MPSSVIRRFAYDARTHRLEVEFVSGRRYAYHNVPARIAAELQGAASKGSYFNQCIRDQFRFTRERG